METACTDPHRPAGRPEVPAAQVELPAGRFAMGDHHQEGYPADGERPVHEVELPAFRIDRTAVTNREFAAFVAETGHRTEAEELGVSAVFHLAVPDTARVVGQVAAAPWWLSVRGADWRRPEGDGSDLDERAEHPVVHVSWNDAQAYCRWAGRRLPTEAEWEYAARGGLIGARYSWGDELTPDGVWRANLWQGDFPVDNTLDDGYATTAPVTAYPPNDFGLFDTSGNVWEWCADWFAADYYGRSPLVDPRGPERGGSRVLRGGSYLCHASYCHRYRVAARSSNPPDSASANVGFRCAGDA